MKYIIAFIVSIAMFATNAYAAPEEFVGIFKGTEKTTVTNCGAYNGVTTSSWSAKHSEIKGTTLQGTGSNDNGDFAITGEVTDNVVSGTIQGVNKWHQAW